MKVLFFTNIPSPYRVDFFNELGKDCDLTVCFERRTASDRNKNWVGENAKNYQEVYLKLKPLGASSSKGSDMAQYIKNHPADIVIFSGYSSPSTMLAILYCRMHGVRYYIEYDGGFNKKDPFFKRMVKSFLIRGAAGHFITCRELEHYLLGLRIPREKLFFYPFSSVRERDILPAVPSVEEKATLREALGIIEKRVVLSVGQFIHRKGFDVLLHAATEIDGDVGVYIVGGTPTEEFLALRERLGLSHVHFIDFMSKAELKKWYAAADLFVFPTREDIWGLVVNEAMAGGLPVVSTDRCVAALELLENGVNGYVVPTGDATALAERLRTVLKDGEQCQTMAAHSLRKIADYTVEAMAKKHVDYFQALCGKEK